VVLFIPEAPAATARQLALKRGARRGLQPRAPSVEQIRSPTQWVAHREPRKVYESTWLCSETVDVVCAVIFEGLVRGRPIRNVQGKASPFRGFWSHAFDSGRMKGGLQSFCEELIEALPRAFHGFQ
jgi:hypothetical protein